MTLRVVIHAPTPAALDRARSNARNLLADVPEAEVEIVVNAAAAEAALAAGDPRTDGLVVLCENSLRVRDLDGGGYRTVPAAITHLARRQREGWAYIRA